MRYVSVREADARSGRGTSLRSLEVGAFQRITAELTERFGGVTAYTHAAAEARWKNGNGEVQEDDVIAIEIVTDAIDWAWWSSFRARLEEELDQDEILIRAHSIQIM